MKPEMRCKVYRVSMRCKVYRVSCADSFSDEDYAVIDSWWATCKYSWGSIDTLHSSWKNAMLHVNDEIARVSAIVEHKWNT